MKKSKVDAIIKRKLEEERQAAAIRERASVSDARKHEREKYELLVIPPDDGSGVCYISQPPTHDTVYVPLHPRFAPRFDANFDPRSFHEQVAVFSTKMQYQAFGNGQRVVWHEYTFRGFR